MHLYKEAYQCVHNLVTAAKTVIVFSITSGANVSFFLNACFLVGVLGEFHGDKAARENKGTGEFHLWIERFLQTTYQTTPLETPQFPPFPSPSPFKVESSLDMRLGFFLAMHIMAELEMYVKLLRWDFYAARFPIPILPPHNIKGKLYQ
ncbi:hypothetical protein V6N13_068737 [Hibiscus sabdariffa]|uniref:Uncharacterized protein n=1 Tax=Hibiscus sabdariffa TaxID=183260 RepID=A0ABR2QNH6_9ROSI